MPSSIPHSEKNALSQQLRRNHINKINEYKLNICLREIEMCGQIY